MEMNLLETVYSYVFGDGDPNADVAQTQLQRTAALIRDKGGAVTAEQLALLLDPTEDGSEQWVLPALLDLGGAPEVTEDGDIIYVFPEIASTSGTVSEASSDDPIIETKLTFSRAPKSTLVAVAMLGALDLTGVVTLGRMGFASTSPRLFAALGTYALAFNGVPIIRWINMRRKNKGIEARNEARLKASRLLREVDRSSFSSSEEVETTRRKIKASRSYGFKRLQRIGKDTKIVYDTAKSQLENAMEEESVSLRSFDQRLESSGEEKG